MSFGLRPSCRPALRARLELARIFEEPEQDTKRRIRELEGRPLFARLVEAGVVSIKPYSAARFAARRFAGYQLRVRSDASTDVLAGQEELLELIARLGRETFEGEFLRAEDASDAERAARCGISEGDARRLREFVDGLYIREELAGPEADAPGRVYSSIAGITVEDGHPALAFFDRDVWKGRYRINTDQRERLLAQLPPSQARKARALLSELDLVERRKSTLYSIIEVVMEVQRDYLLSGARERRQPLTQRAVAAHLNVHASLINRLILNKAVELPWGVEVPLKELLPSRKAVFRDRVYDLAVRHPAATDAELADEVARLFGTRLSRPSIAAYRKESGALRRRSVQGGSSRTATC